jgi:hypothetical protein
MNAMNMKTGKAPKLLFHGTAAPSVYASYLQAKHLISLKREKPAELEEILAKDNALEYFSKFGPSYPVFWRNDKTYEKHTVCLDRLHWALNFALGWTAKYEHDKIRFFSSVEKEFTISDFGNLYTPFASTLIEGLKRSNSSETSDVPGAVLMVDYQYLESNDLIGPAFGEEICTARYLPWEAIVGILFTSGKDKSRSFSAFLLKNKAALRALELYLYTHQRWFTFTKNDNSLKFLANNADAYSSTLNFPKPPYLF